MIALLRAFLRRLRDRTGATTVEHVLVMSVALTGAVGFKELGTKLHSQLDREADHIVGKGMPRNGDLASLAANFQTPELDCPGFACAATSVASNAGPASGAESPTSTPTSPASPGSVVRSSATRSGQRTVAGGAALVGSGPPPPPGLTLAQRERRDDCEERLESSPQTYFPLDPKSKKRSDLRKSRDEAIALLCLEMACECPATKSSKECVAQWQCIYEHIAQHPTSEYFDKSSVAAGDECPDPASKTDDNLTIQSQCLDPEITRWACYKSPPLLGDDGKPIPPIVPSTRHNLSHKAEVSQLAGEEAANHFASANFGGYDCRDAGGPHVFDVLCIEGDSVVIIEAKGGGSTLGNRQNIDHTTHVQQGTKDYALAIADQMRRRAEREPNPAARADGLERADAVARAVEAGNARYFEVRQDFSSSGTPLVPSLKEFDLDNPDTICRNCKCTSPHGP